MINQYKIIDYRVFGLPSIEVCGEEFHYQDIYVMVGKNQYTTTFELKVNSFSFLEYGESVTGVIFYDKKELLSLEDSVQSSKGLSREKIRVDCRLSEITNKKRSDLKYAGIKTEDISSISYLPYERQIEFHETGEKRLPNVVEVEVDFNDIDPDVLNKNYLLRKHNSGTKLAQFEKEQLIGITLAFNNGRIDSRVLATLGFTKEDLETNLEIWMSLYKVKKRRNQLTDIEMKNYSEIKNILLLEKASKFVKELAAAKPTEICGGLGFEAINNIFKAVKDFSPSILMHGKNQIYWDVDSYIHIALRHLKDYQVGDNKSKTPFSYKAGDLKLLVEKVLQMVEAEIGEYFLSTPTSEFRRVGKMAIFYNGDHYHLRISPSGRLVQFHAV